MQILLDLCLEQAGDEILFISELFVKSGNRASRSLQVGSYGAGVASCHVCKLNSWETPSKRKLLNVGALSYDCLLAETEGWE